jgi:hypothetical protein
MPCSTRRWRRAIQRPRRKAAGIQVETDPRSADFAKVRIGDTRVDFLGGEQQIIKYFAQMVSGSTVSSTTGRETKLGDTTRNATSRWDITLRLVEGKLQPVASFMVAVLKQKDFHGNPINVPKEVLGRMVPLLASSVYEAVSLYGPAGAAVALPEVVGLGTQTYTPQSSITKNGVKLEIDGKAGTQYAEEMMQAESRAVQRVAALPNFKELEGEKLEKITSRIVEHERAQVKERWLRANAIGLARAAKDKRPSVKAAVPAAPRSKSLDMDERQEVAAKLREKFPAIPANASVTTVLARYKKAVKPNPIEGTQ